MTREIFYVDDINVAKACIAFAEQLNFSVSPNICDMEEGMYLTTGSDRFDINWIRNEEYADGDVIHIDLAQEVSFLNKAAIKQTLQSIPGNSKVIIDAKDTIYIAHDILDLIHEFKSIRAKEEHIKVKLKGFKKEYQLENNDDNHVTIVQEYDALKRVMVQKEVKHFDKE